MMKFTKRLIAIFLMLVVVLASTPTTVFAESEFMDKGKTYKLTVNKDLYDNLRRVSEEIAAGKSATYTIDVPKGVLHMQLLSSSEFKVEISDSKNKVVKKITPFFCTGEEDYYYAKSAVVLSKGKYKLKISPAQKKSGAYVEGFVNMIKNDKSMTIPLDKDHFAYVTKEVPIS